MLKLTNYSNYILKNISFHLKPHQNIIILGSNGAGKSTLAKVLCGITPSHIELNQKPLKDYSTIKRTNFINYIPAKLEIFDEYITVDEFLNLSRLHSLLRSHNMLKLLNIEALKNKSLLTLSSGEQQLIMLASALLHNAQITIFDEPTANLDPQRSRDIFSILQKNLFQQKIIITHDLNLAHRLGYDIIYIKEGKMIFQGSSKTFFNESNLNDYFGTSVKMIDEGILNCF